MATTITTNWDGVPVTRSTANIVEIRVAENIQAVKITKGSFRSAPVSGFFELASQETDYKIDKNGKKTIEVKLGWFGVKPPTTWAHVTILGDSNIINNYSGSVVHNISGHRRG